MFIKVHRQVSKEAKLKNILERIIKHSGERVLKSHLFQRVMDTAGLPEQVAAGI